MSFVIYHPAPKDPFTGKPTGDPYFEIPGSLIRYVPVPVYYYIKGILQPLATLTPTHAAYQDASGHMVDISGSNFTYNGSGVLTGGTITSIDLLRADGLSIFTLSSLANTSAADFGTMFMSPSTRYAYMVSLVDDATTVTGSDSPDWIEVGGGDDAVSSDAESDFVVKFKSGNLTYDGGSGVDTISVHDDLGSEPAPATGLVIDLEAGTGTNPYGGTFTLTSVEGVIGSKVADTIDGSSVANVIGAQTFQIDGDTIRTFAGEDTVQFGFSSNGAQVDGGADADTLLFSIGGNGIHTLDILNQANNAGAFSGSTFSNFESYGITSFSNGNYTFNFNGSNNGETVSIRGGTQNITLNDGNDTLEHLFFATAVTADGGAGTDTLSVFGFLFPRSVLDLTNSANNTGLYANGTFTNFEIYTMTGGGLDFHGSANGETVNGANDLNQSADILAGLGGNDILNSFGGSDVLEGGAGDDTLDGGTDTGANNDTAVYSGNSADYSVTYTAATHTVTIVDTRPGTPDGTDTVKNVERFQFAGGVVLSLADLIGQGPAIAGGNTASTSIVENGLAVMDIQSTDSGGDTEGAGLTYKIISGLDGGAADGFDFFINAATGVLTFRPGDRPDFEAPHDAGSNNVYDVTVRVTDSQGISDDQTISVTVTNQSPEILNGTAGVDTLTGGSDLDRIFGLGGNDTLSGFANDDILTGGMGRDIMSGGTGLDDFDFNSKSESGKTAGTRDRITDFTHNVDDIDLRTIDAKTGSGNQNFKFIAAQAFHHKAGELHYKFSGANALVEGDTNGDGKADFQIELTGHKVLTAGDFIL